MEGHRFAPGSRIGDYTVEGDLDGGWNVEAYSASHILLPRRARLLVLGAAFVDHKPAAVQMLREACLVEAMQHPGVPRVFATGMIAGRPWIASELLVGVSLSDALAAGPLPVMEVLALLRDAAEVLEHAHRAHVVHRNLRPEVLLRTHGRAFPIVITGWSDARLQGSGVELVDTRADVLALGAVAFTALTGARPTMSCVERCPGAPRALTELIDRMLAEEPEARPSCAEVRALAMRIAELTEVAPPDDEDDDLDIIEVGVELVDISRQPPPVPRRSRWTPALGTVTPPHAVARIDLDRK